MSKGGFVPNNQIIAQQAAVLVQRMMLGAEDAAMLVMGDSTGASNTRWVYLLAQRLGAMFPAWTVLYRTYKDTNDTWNSATTLQTGTNGRTLTVWNGSISGTQASYPVATQARWSVMASMTPQLVMVNYGHNTTGVGSTYRATHYALMRKVQETWPTAGIICTLQNPRGTGDAERTNHLIRMRTVMELCASEGYGCINVTQAFLNDSSYTANLLLLDGIHPNDNAGSPLWANEVARHFKASRLVVPQAPPMRETWRFIPASQFLASENAPTLAIANTVPAWTMDPTTQMSVNAAVDIPSHWQSFDIHFVWTVALGTGYTSGNNGVAWEAGLQNLGTGGFSAPMPASGASGAFSAPGGIVAGVAPNQGSAYPTVWTRVATNQSASYRPIGIRARRVAADALDTVTTNVFLLGVLLVRAS